MKKFGDGHHASEFLSIWFSFRFYHQSTRSTKEFHINQYLTVIKNSGDSHHTLTFILGASH